MFKWFGGSKTVEPKPVAEPTTQSATSDPITSDSGNILQGSLNKLKQAFSQTGKSLIGHIRGIVQDAAIDDDVIDDIEESLIRADVGVETATAITDKLRDKKHDFKSSDELIAFLQDEFTRLLTPVEHANELAFADGKLNIYLVVGVNGVGKTTFIGKLAHHFKRQGKKVLIGAGDTFRAAAEDQLAIWAQRAGVELVRRDGADPAAVIYDTLSMAKSQQADVILLDTAGRLQNKFNLMEELRKIRRVIDKEKPDDAVYESLLVLDATTGQNALKQAEVFKEAVAISGVVLTKMDSSAKGGIVLTIAKEHGLPVKLVGVGEGIDDLRAFDTQSFIDALFAER